MDMSKKTIRLKCHHSCVQSWHKYSLFLRWSITLIPFMEEVYLRWMGEVWISTCSPSTLLGCVHGGSTWGIGNTCMEIIQALACQTKLCQPFALTQAFYISKRLGVLSPMASHWTTLLEVQYITSKYFPWFKIPRNMYIYPWATQVMEISCLLWPRGSYFY